MTKPAAYTIYRHHVTCTWPNLLASDILDKHVVFLGSKVVKRYSMEPVWLSTHHPPPSPLNDTMLARPI